mmetsp:Transcript_71140/g.206000  ORF Transcript_71140/g.206000 Transcript_71140/m.206000 type:complete len:605 (+) Transcript_71140:188-2002(+)
MKDYENGRWGFPVIWGLRASVFPRALALALPNGIIAFVLGWLIESSDEDKELTKNAFSALSGFTSVLFFVLYFRSNVAYGRWWEGGTLLQQTRGEWFNAYSSLLAFTSPDPARQAEVEAYQHMLARLMSLLFCSALQQVSPNRNRAFEIIDSTGVDPASLHFLSQSSDRVEVILQWVQRSTILNMFSGILPIPPPVMSRAFQEISRGIVNLQNARKIADFPFPFPYAQASVVMLVTHWAMCPIFTCLLLNHVIAGFASFCIVFFLWCIHFIAIELESPFGSEDNDLPMHQMQADWNNSIATLLAKRANCPPNFSFDAASHRQLGVRMSDGSPALQLKAAIIAREISGSSFGGKPEQDVAQVKVDGVGDSAQEEAETDEESECDACTSKAVEVVAPKEPKLVNESQSGGSGAAITCSPTAALGSTAEGSVSSSDGDVISGATSSDRGSPEARALLLGGRGGGGEAGEAAGNGTKPSEGSRADARRRPSLQATSASQATAAALSRSRFGSDRIASSSRRSSLVGSLAGGEPSSGRPSTETSTADAGRRLIGAQPLSGCSGPNCFAPIPRVRQSRSSQSSSPRRQDRRPFDQSPVLPATPASPRAHE